MFCPRYLCIYIPAYYYKFQGFFKFPDSSLVNNFIVYGNVEIMFIVTVLWTKYTPICLFSLRDNLFAHSPSYNSFTSWLMFIIRLSTFGPD